VEEEIENILNSRYGITVATSRLNDWFEHPRSIHYMSTNVQGALKPSPENNGMGALGHIFTLVLTI